MSSFAIPLCKTCSFISHLSNSSPSPVAGSLSTARHRQLHLRKPSTAPLFATNFPTDTTQEIELHGEEASSEEEEEEEDFDAQQLELDARQVVKEFSDSLSRQLKIGSFIQLVNYFL